MSPIAYSLAIVGMALSHSLDAAQTVIFIAMLCVEGVAWVCGVNMFPKITSGRVALVVVLTIIALRLLAAPYWLHEQVLAERNNLQGTLTKIAIGRPLDFTGEHVDFIYTGKDRANVNVTLILTNRGPEMLVYKFTKAYLHWEGAKEVPVPAKAIADKVYIPGGSQRSFSFPTVPNANTTLPIKMRMGWVISYDNLPPVALRTSVRDIEDTITSISPEVEQSHILHQEEK